MTSPQVEVEVARSIRDIDATTLTQLQWGSVELEHSRPYLDYLEEIDGENRLYFVVSASGRAVALSQAVITSDRTLPLSRPAEMLTSAEQGTGFQAEYEERLYPSIVVRNLWDCLPVTRSDDEEPSRWWDALFAAIEAQAKRAHARSVTCLNVARTSGSLGDYLADRGYIGGHYCATAEIDLGTCITFDDYLRRFTGDSRRAIQRERRRFLSNGLTVRKLAPETHLRLVVEQEAQNWAKHGEQISVESLWRLRRALVTHLGPQACLVGAMTQDGIIIASGIHLTGRNVYHVFTFGADYRVKDLAGSYQELTFYSAVEQALSLGVQRVNLGFEAYQAKIFRGAVLRHMYAYVLPLHQDGRQFAGALLPLLSERTVKHLSSLTFPRLRSSGS